VNRLVSAFLRVGKILVPDDASFAAESTLTTLSAHSTATHSTHVTVTSTIDLAMSTVWLCGNLCAREHGEAYDCCGADSGRPEFQHRASTIV
jgi:hypothetical protein